MQTSTDRALLEGGEHFDALVSRPCEITVSSFRDSRIRLTQPRIAFKWVRSS